MAAKDEHGNIMEAVELKSGNASLSSSFIRSQIEKDSALLGSGQVKAITWIINGKADAKLISALKEVGITVVVNPAKKVKR